MGILRTLHRCLAALAAAALMVLSPAAMAQVAVPPLSGAVTDLTATLKADERAGLEAALRAFAQRRGSQIAVLIVPGTQPETIEQYAIRVAEAWKIGRAGKDDGVILVVAREDRTVRIEVGYGLEGAIPDAIARRIIEEIIVPHFRRGDFGGGLTAATAALMKLIEGEKLPAPDPAWQRGGGFDMNSLVVLFVALIVVSGVARALLGRTLGALAGGGVAGAIAWTMFGSLIAGIVVGVVGFVVALFPGAMGGRGFGGGFGRGGGFGGGGGGFRGGGGGFGGGGASGRW